MGDACFKTSKGVACFSGKSHELESHLICVSASTFTIVWSWASYLSLWNLFLHYKTQLLAPTTQQYEGSYCSLYILLGVSKQRILGSEVICLPNGNAQRVIFLRTPGCGGLRLDFLLASSLHLSSKELLLW